MTLLQAVYVADEDDAKAVLKKPEERGEGDEQNDTSVLEKIHELLLQAEILYMGVSKNSGTPRWMVDKGNLLKWMILGGTPIFGNIHIFFFLLLAIFVTFLPKKLIGGKFLPTWMDWVLQFYTSKSRWNPRCFSPHFYRGLLGKIHVLTTFTTIGDGSTTAWRAVRNAADCAWGKNKILKSFFFGGDGDAKKRGNGFGGNVAMLEVFLFFSCMLRRMGEKQDKLIGWKF